jgi:hypothetical protein
MILRINRNCGVVFSVIVVKLGPSAGVNICDSVLFIVEKSRNPPSLSRHVLQRSTEFACDQVEFIAICL